MAKKRDKNASISTSQWEDRERRRTKTLFKKAAPSSLQTMPTWLLVTLTILGALLILYALHQWNLMEKSSLPPRSQEIIVQ